MATAAAPACWRKTPARNGHEDNPSVGGTAWNSHRSGIIARDHCGLPARCWRGAKLAARAECVVDLALEDGTVEPGDDDDLPEAELVEVPDAGDEDGLDDTAGESDLPGERRRRWPFRRR